MSLNCASVYETTPRNRNIAAAIYGCISCMLLGGCNGSGQLNIWGAYFPVWLLAMILGVAVAFACRYLFVRLGLEPYVGPLVLIYLCITVSVACLVWLLIG